MCSVSAVVYRPLVASERYPAISTRLLQKSHFLKGASELLNDINPFTANPVKALHFAILV